MKFNFVAASAAAMILFLLIFLGVLSVIRIVQHVQQPVTLIYEKRFGSYKNVRTASARIHSQIQILGISNAVEFGLFFDNRRTHNSDEKRFVAGCLVPSEYTNQLSKVSNLFRIGFIPAITNFGTDFPYKNDLSFAVGVLKVYPALHAFIKNKYIQTLAVMEQYDIKSGIIQYRAIPLEYNSFFSNFFY